MSTRIMHIVFSNPRKGDDPEIPDKVNPVETISQFVFLGIVIIMCFYQPPFLVDLINQSIAIIAQIEIMMNQKYISEIKNNSSPLDIK